MVVRKDGNCCQLLSIHRFSTEKCLKKQHQFGENSKSEFDTRETAKREKSPTKNVSILTWNDSV